MSEFGSHLGWLALQVTVVAAAALGLSAWAARRGSDAARAVLAAAVLLLAGLTVVALAPLPETWTWGAPALAQRPAPAAVDVVTEPGESAPAGAGVELPLAWPGWLGAVAEEARRPWPKATVVVAFVFLTVAIVRVMNLLAGLAAVANLRCRSRPVADASLRQLAESLRAELGCRRTVALRESDAAGLPATVGWLRPAVLLPADWRSWDDAERRAVLAHELAHVRGGDYAAGLLARLCLALHFYHPLVYWLAGRLRLQQELAADARAARLAGGRAAYRHALAALALRPPVAGPVGPARPVLLTFGSLLLRRVHMLRVTDDARPLSRGGRATLIGSLAALAVAVSALRGPAPAAPAAPPEPAKPAAAGREPFDLTYLPADCRSFFAVRPAAILSHPDLRPFAAKLRKELDAALRAMGRTPPAVEIGDIEQVVGSFHVTTKGTGEPGSRSVVLGTSSLLIKMGKDVDWPKLMRDLFGDVTVREVGGQTLIRVTSPVLGPMPICLLALDARTLVFVSDEKAAEKLPPPGRGPTRDWGTAWGQVERADFAVAVANPDRKFADQFAADLKGVPAGQTLVETVRRLVIGVEVGEEIVERLILDVPDEETAAVAAAAGEAVRKLLRAELAKDTKGDDPATSRAWDRLIGDLIRTGDLTRAGAQVRAVGRSKVPLRELVPPDIGAAEGKPSPAK